MLVIDDNMFKLAKMQESLLRATDSNREENLSNYIKTVVQIDKQAFADILEELKHMDEHNQSLEEEVQFLEKIKNCYNQLLELQLGFRRVCELYGNQSLVLSDLSQLNIEYIDNRISTINGYLINLKNIDINKEKLQELNGQLVVEEKKKDVLSDRLLQLEEELRSNFINAEGRFIITGQLQYTSVVTEYKNLDLDFEKLLVDTDTLDRLVSSVELERREVEDKLNIAQICYNNSPNADSRQILSEINVDALKVKYKLTLLKILKLLSQNYNNYDQAREKREKLLDLIKYRILCLETLGMRISIDPFARTRVGEQLNTILSMTDNSKNINRIRKEISLLIDRNEEMISQNSNYLISLSDTKALLESKVRMSDIDISSVDLVWDQSLLDEVKVTLPNQVVGVRDVADKFKMNIVGQKTSGVIRRVNQMATSDLDVTINHREAFVPELVIVPKTQVKNEESKNDGDIFVPSLTMGSDELDVEADINKNLDETDTPLFEDYGIDEKFFETRIDDNSSSTSLVNDESEPEDNIEIFVPTLTIVPESVDDEHSVVEENNDNTLFNDFGIIDGAFEYNGNNTSATDIQTEETKDDVNVTTGDTFEASAEYKPKLKVVDDNEDTSDLFSTVDPFSGPLMFDDRSDQSLISETSLSASELELIAKGSEDNLELHYSNEEEMPDVFWTTEDVVEDNLEDEVPSFDDQINLLLGKNTNIDSKKLVLSKERAA